MMTVPSRSDRLAAAYRSGEAIRGEGERESAIVRHLPLVHSVVERLCAHLPSSVDRDDLFHAGVIGLIDALGRFDPGRDNAFSTYAVLRIRGQIIDELRARDWVPRGARERAREYQRAVNDLSASLGRLPDDRELAARLAITEADLPGREQEAQLAVQVSLDAPVGEDGSIGDRVAAPPDAESDPGIRLERADRRAVLLKVLATLTEQERRVVKLYYFENLLMKEIAALLGVTESRVCQIHGRILAVLRLRLGVDGPIL
jgi:RNA polymerase sigma factor for flagellar operon FliA